MKKASKKAGKQERNIKLQPPWQRKEAWGKINWAETRYEVGQWIETKHSKSNQTLPEERYFLPEV